MLIDGNSLTYRAFFALPTDMATASGQVTNAVFGFTSMLAEPAARPPARRHRGGLRPARADVPPRARSTTYKANRDRGARHPAPADGPRPPGRRDAAACPILEAGRLRGRRHHRHARHPGRATAGDDVIIVTGDRDAYQLVEDPHVKVLYNKRGVSRLRALRRGRHPRAHRRHARPSTSQYAALRGDPSDNLPGVPGVGEKTAAKLINTYGDLDGIFATSTSRRRSCARTWPRTRPRSAQNAEVMVLVRDVPLDVDLDDLVHGRASTLEEVRDALRLPRVPHPVRPPGRGARRRRRGRRRRRSSAGDVLEAEVATDRRRPRPTPCSPAWRAADRRAARRRRPRGTGARGPLAARAASPSSPTPRGGEVAWIPAALLGRRRAWRAALGGAGRRRRPPLVAHDAKPLVRACSSSASTCAPSRSTPCSPPTCSTRPRPATCSRSCSTATPRLELPERRRPPPRASSTSAATADRRRPSSRPARAGRRPARRAAAARRSTRRACGRSTTTSRCRSCGCWPAWRTSASASTSPSCRRLNDRLVAECDAL